MLKTSTYFTIGEVARILGMSPSSLRNWEQTGLITPIRSQGRYRLYSNDALRMLKRVKYLRKVKRINLAGIRHMLPAQTAAQRPASYKVKKSQAIGAQLSRLRSQQRLTLTAVAQQAELSISFLSALERGQANASIATLQKLAQLYKTNVLSFFGHEGAVRRLVRPRDRKVLQPDPGVQMELLAFGNTLMEPHLFRIGPAASSGGSYHHEGEEFIYVLQGSLEIWLDEIERYTLKAGDSLYFESSHAHSWRNLSDKETVLLWVNTPPTF